MGDIINLRAARKARAKIEKDKTAAENRIKFGQLKALKLRKSASAALENKRLHGHRLDSTNDEQP